jgi:ribonuclease HII
MTPLIGAIFFASMPAAVLPLRARRRCRTSPGTRERAALGLGVQALEISGMLPRMARLNLAEIRQRYLERERPLPSDVERLLRRDERPGARALIERFERRRHENRAEGQRLRHMLRYERELWEQNVTLVAGIDEAGMSPLAGPVAAAAVVLEVGWRAPHVNDSKQLSAEQRAELAGVIRREAKAFAVAFVQPEEIDQLNIYWAGILAMRRAVEALAISPQHLLIDARKLRELPVPQTRIVKGDELSLSIAAASILAKTERDALMVAYDRQYPAYGFAQHKGYPVRQHRRALEEHGACPIHRRSFARVQEALRAAESRS